MEGKYANIIIDISHEQLDRTFQYTIPERHRGKITPGMLVQIPFGKGNKMRKGFVLEITDKPEYEISKIKELSEVIMDDFLVESKLISLAWWMKENYGSTMIAALKTVLPVKRQMKPKENRSITLLLTSEKLEEQLLFYQEKHQLARYRLLSALKEANTLSWSMVTNKLNIPSATIKLLESQGIVKIEVRHIYRNPVQDPKTLTRNHVLNKEQQIAVDSIWEQSVDEMPVSLIHGITGSGKTEVYMALIEKVVESGRQAIVLIPEIALTYQTVMRFYQRFGKRVSTLHSRLSEGERYDQFERAKRGELDVMIGPRSALFTPFSNVGLIVIDEEHEPSYKSDSMPKYHARETAIYLAKLHHAKVVLGSATPSIDSYYKAKQDCYFLVELKERAAQAILPVVYTIDMREELKEGNRSILSRRLYELIEERLEKKEQIMLFLNRRGYAGFISCRSCGHVMKCPHCDVSLSSHQNGKLVCHYCGYEQPMVTKCPECSSPYISGMKAGTEQIEQFLKQKFPSAGILRMDTDTTRTKEGHAEILSAFANKEADILVGTQMIVKGHDFPAVTLVGILAADMSLHVNDYRAAERTFQLLTQAAGRAGRGAMEGEVVIQTYSPQHYAITTAANQDYQAFYEREICYRSMLDYPPSAHMLAILTEALAQETAMKTSMQLYNIIDGIPYDKKEMRIIGPAAATIGRINDIYRQILYCKSKDYQCLTLVKDTLEEFLLTLSENEKKQIRVQFDFDPIHAY